MDVSEISNSNNQNDDEIEIKEFFKKINMVLKHTFSKIPNSITFVNNIQKKTSYLYDLYINDKLTSNILGYSVMPKRRLLQYYESIARDIMLAIKLNLVPFIIESSYGYFNGSTTCPHRRQEIYNKLVNELNKREVDGVDRERLIKLIFNYS